MTSPGPIADDTVAKGALVDQAIRSSEISYGSVLVEDVKTDVKLSDTCRRGGCLEPKNDCSDYCDPHHEDQKRYVRECMQRKRDEWEADGRCTRCGGPRYRTSKSCRMCLRRLGRLPEPDVKIDVKAEKRQRIAARIIAWENSPTNTGRIRMRGGDRGRRSIEQLDDEDLQDARESLTLGVEGLDHWRDLEADESAARKPKAQREDAKNQALAELVKAGRWISEVVRRHGYEVQIAVSDGDDED